MLQKWVCFWDKEIPKIQKFDIRVYHECIHVSVPNKFLIELILSFWIPNISFAPLGFYEIFQISSEVKILIFDISVDTSK